MGCQKHFTKLQKMKNTIRKKANKNWKKTWNSVLFWVQRLYPDFQATKSENDKQSAQRKI